MITQKVTIDGYEYSVSSTSQAGVERAIESLRFSLETIKNNNIEE